MIRTRIAPSPTGEDLHIGNVYTALINYAFAKKNKGRFILRIEDTDKKRLIKGSEERILASLHWLGLKYDEGPKIGGVYGPYRQSQRLGLYKNYAQKLVEADHAYYCFCSPQRLAKMRKEQQKKGLPPKYDGKCRKLNKERIKQESKEKCVIRLKVPQAGKTSFKDLIHGEIKFKNALLDDQILIKSDGYPTYHLAVVVDDHLMRITHVIRGEEWISSTPKHILLYQFFGWSPPKFAHHPLLRNQKRQKLSKRRDPVWISWYQKQGFLPEAILNYLALMGWSMPDGREVFSLEEFIEEFSLEKISTSAPVFDLEKLEWLNGEYIRKAQRSKVKAQIYNFLGEKYPPELIEKTVPLIQTRIKKFSDYLPLCEFFFQRPTRYEREVNKKWLKEVVVVFQKQKDWQAKSLYAQMSKLAEKLRLSKSKLFMQIRIAVTGKRVGPPLFESLQILGKKEALQRLKFSCASES